MVETGGISDDKSRAGQNFCLLTSRVGHQKSNGRDGLKLETSSSSVTRWEGESNLVRLPFWPLEPYSKPGIAMVLLQELPDVRTRFMERAAYPLRSFGHPSGSTASLGFPIDLKWL